MMIMWYVIHDSTCSLRYCRRQDISNLVGSKRAAAATLFVREEGVFQPCARCDE